MAQDIAEADLDAFVTGAVSPRRARVAKIVNLTGAVSSVALVLGVAVWGYNLAMRDGSRVPVIEAMGGPMRVAPENPGGQIAAHLGLAVNQVAAEGSASPLPDRIVLAPAPVDLADEDAPGIGPRSTQSLSQPATDAAVARALALAEDLVQTPDDPATTPLAEAGTGADTGGGLARSKRPQPRPERLAGMATVTAVEQTSSAAAAPVRDIDAATLRPGTRLVQIGAFDTVDLARAEWDRVAARAGALMEDKGRVIQAAVSGGREFYRLRVHGFASEDDSRRFCAAIESGDLRCIPVNHR